MRLQILERACTLSTLRASVLGAFPMITVMWGIHIFLITVHLIYKNLMSVIGGADHC